MPNDFDALILSRHLQWRFLKLCIEENVIDVSRDMQVEMRPFLERAVLSQADKSHLLASVFMRPELRMRSLPTDFIRDIRSTTLKIELAQEHANAGSFDDFPLLYSYATALHGRVPPEQLRQQVEQAALAEEEVVRLFGRIPESDGNGNPALMEDFLNAILAKVPRRSYSKEQVSAYAAYREAEARVSGFASCYSDLHDMWKFKEEGIAIAIHPDTKSDYSSVVQNNEIDKEIDETQILFLVVRELGTLPIGRTLSETLALAETPEGSSIRARVGDLHAELLAGSKGGVPALVESIRKDIDEYRVLVQNLQSPNTLSNVTDIAINLVGFIPFVGSLANAVGLAKSLGTAALDRTQKARLKSMLWAQYRGHSF